MTPDNPIDDWNPATDEGAPPPTPTAPTTIVIDPPVVDSAVDSGRGYITVVIEEPIQLGLTPVVRYRVKDSVAGSPITPGPWIEQRFYSYTVSGGLITLATNPTPVNTVLEVQVAFISAFGTYSDWSEPIDEVTVVITDLVIGGDLTVGGTITESDDPVAPIALIEFTVADGVHLGNVQFNAVTPIDSHFDHIVVYRVPDGVTLNKATHTKLTYACAPGAAVSGVDGDPAIVNVFGPHGSVKSGWSYSGDDLVHVTSVESLIATSPNGINWTPQIAPVDNDWYEVAWSSTLGIYVSVGAAGTTRAMSSPDGETWTLRTPSSDSTWRAVKWAPSLGIFCAVASAGTGRCMTSADGTSWTARTIATVAHWGIEWSEDLDLFVAVAQSGTGQRVSTSPNGTTWTQRTTPADNNWQSVAWSPSLTLFAAVANTGTGRVMTSPDGINWTLRNDTATEDGAWTSVVWAASLSLFVAVANGGNNRIMTSPDGINWTSRFGNSATFNGLAWSQELGLLVAAGTLGRLYTSTDGINWTVRSFTSHQWRNGTYSPEQDKFVFPASTGSTFDEPVQWTGLTIANTDVWRVAIDIKAVSGTGNIDLVFDGTTPEAWGENWTTTGLKITQETADTANTRIDITADTTVVATVGAMYGFKQTASCIPQGVWDYYAFPANRSGLEGTGSTPITGVTII